MFYRQHRHYHTHGLFLILSLIAAFILGRKSQEYGYTIISRGCGTSNSDKGNEKNKERHNEKDKENANEKDKLNDLTPGGNYPL